MKKQILFFLIGLMWDGVVCGQTSNTTFLGQEVTDNNNVIVTAVPFLTITPDTRSAGMGDVGAATPGDVWSQHANASKYAMMNSEYGVGVAYVPWLSNISEEDECMVYMVGYYQRPRVGTFGFSMRYFTIGELSSTEAGDSVEYTVDLDSPMEYSFDLSFSRRFGTCFVLGVTPRITYTNLIGASAENYHSSEVVSFDVSGMYVSHLGTGPRYASLTQIVCKCPKTLSIGFSLSNIGPKLAYSKSRREFIPTMLRLGIGYSQYVRNNSKVSVYADVQKLLVPTPPHYIRDSEGNVEAVLGKDNNVGVMKGIFQSFNDAPGGTREEMEEFTVGVGMEYAYNEKLFGRIGYFNESENKGNRKYATFGVGYKLFGGAMEFSYLLPVKGNDSPLADTFRITLSYEAEK
ncbi:MAG: type IX secretion system outer membrane channel protein PorV [Bacteroidales bacterium]|nr:type IX secretion system outer membrane channel protein PorV [Bacteroidales bacterium]